MKLDAPQRIERLVVFPLVTDEEAELPYLLLADARQGGHLEITEVGSGSVPTLRVSNRGEQDVLVLDGEPLGLDVVGGRAHWTRLHAWILQGSLIHALGGRARRRTVAADGGLGPATPDDRVGGLLPSLRRYGTRVSVL